jgi:hypothetical protein
MLQQVCPKNHQRYETSLNLSQMFQQDHEVADAENRKFEKGVDLIV